MCNLDIVSIYEINKFYKYLVFYDRNYYIISYYYNLEYHTTYSILHIGNNDLILSEKFNFLSDILDVKFPIHMDIVESSLYEVRKYLNNQIQVHKIKLRLIKISKINII